jgi:hypothetical protein
MALGGKKLSAALLTKKPNWWVGARSSPARRRSSMGKSKYCLRWTLLKTGGDSKASRSTVLRMLIRSMTGPLILFETAKLTGCPEECRGFSAGARRKRFAAAARKSSNPAAAS